MAKPREYVWAWCRNCHSLCRMKVGTPFWCPPRRHQWRTTCEDKDRKPLLNQDAADAAERLGGWQAVLDIVEVEDP